jgi:hypothetical protein
MVSETIKCAWPNCGATTAEPRSYKEMDESGWYLYYGPVDPDLADCGWQLPEHGWLCPHHHETLEAFEKRDIERFKLLASI